MKTNMYKGIVVKVTAEAIVLLCDGGQFKNVPREKDEVPKIGQTYTYIEKQNRRFTYLTKNFALASSIFIAIFGYLLLTLMKPNEAYMFAVDINPSIEIFTDEQLNVVDIHYLNEDGKIVTNAIEYENESIQIVMEKIIDIAVKKKYLSTDKEGIVALTVVPLKEERQLNNTEIRTSVEKALKLNAISANVSVNNGSKKLLEEAHKKNLSINKYQLYKDLKKNNIHLNLNDLKDKPMRVIMNETKYLLENSKVKEENNIGVADDSTDVVSIQSKEIHNNTQTMNESLVKGQQPKKNENREDINTPKKPANDLLQNDNNNSVSNSKKSSDIDNDDDDDDNDERNKKLAELEQKRLEEKKKEQEKVAKEKEKEEKEKKKELEKKKKEQEKIDKEKEKEEREKQEELEKKKKEQEKAEKEREKEEREKQEELEKEKKEQEKEELDDEDDEDDDD